MIIAGVRFLAVCHLLNPAMASFTELLRRLSRFHWDIIPQAYTVNGALEEQHP
jgi:hypothetical protein